MTEKTFRVVSNSEEYLTADTIALALLKQVTLVANKKDVIFGVAEVEKTHNLAETEENLVSWSGRI